MAYILNAKVNGQWVGIPAIQGEQGETGQTGATGNGIASIEKTGTSGLVDTYTITYTNGDTDTFTVTNGQDGTVLDVQINGTSIVSSGVANIGIVDNVTSTSTTSALSANQGKVLQDEITHLQGIGRFLALWDATTGLAETNPPVSPYTYKTGDYFIVGVVGATNYKPSGSSYTTGVASTTVETETIAVGNVYYYDGTTWKLQAGGGGGTITDVQVNGTSVVTSGVANISKASNDGTVTGVVQLSNTYGSQTVSGYLAAVDRSYNGFVGAQSTSIASVGGVKAYVGGMSVAYNASQSLTDAQKEQARTNIGAGQTTVTFVDWVD